MNHGVRARKKNGPVWGEFSQAVHGMVRVPGLPERVHALSLYRERDLAQLDLGRIY
jgi:hypothetical protein